MSAVNEAIAYAERGYKVMPCLPKSKMPATAHGCLDASDNADQVAAWWDENPDFNIAVATDGLLVLDVDASQGGTANPYLASIPEDIERQAGAVAITPRSGKHFWFRQPDGAGLRNTASKIADRVDTRADGGYVLVAPSRTEHGGYQWVQELPQIDRVPVAPRWLLDQLDGKTPATQSVSTTGDDVWPEGNRNHRLTSWGGDLRRKGASEATIYATLQSLNAERCVPPLPDSEVRRIAKSVSRYEPDQIAQAVAEGLADELFGAGGPNLNAVTIRRLTSAELDAGDYAIEYLVSGVLPKGQPGVIGGQSKSCKTATSIALFMSLSAGDPFLGRFNVPRPVRCGMLSAENGLASIQSQARRIAASFDRRLSDYKNLIWSDTVVNLCDSLHLKQFETWIRDDGLEAICVDPVYLLFPNIGDKANNLYEWGKYLNPLAAICQRTNCTLVLNHHFRKTGIAEPYGVPELNDLSNSGIANFARWWLLLNRRSKYDPENLGRHELWMSVGGSAGHSNAFSIDLDEGILAGRWTVELSLASEARKEIAEDREALKQQAKAGREHGRLMANVAKVERALRRYPDGETKTSIRDASGLSGTRVTEALIHMEETGEVEQIVITKNGKQVDGWRLISDDPDKPDRTDKSG